MQAPQLTIVPCPCCGYLMFGIIQFGADLGFQIRAGMNFQWPECRICGYGVDGIQFQSPVFKGQPQVKKSPIIGAKR